MHIIGNNKRTSIQMKNYESNVPYVNLDDVTPGGRAKEFGPEESKFIFYKHGHVAYQTKGNEE